MARRPPVTCCEREKELTRASDALARARHGAAVGAGDRAVRVLTRPTGERTFPELFGEHPQLLVYHLMMGPAWEEACSGCTYTGDTFDRAVEHLPHRDVGFVAISRAPVEAIEAYKARMGWSFDWVSCGRTTFNQDLGAAAGAPYPDGVELHGLSAFAREGDDVFHTYSDRSTAGPTS